MVSTVFAQPLPVFKTVFRTTVTTESSGSTTQESANPSAGLAIRILRLGQTPGTGNLLRGESPYAPWNRAHLLPGLLQRFAPLAAPPRSGGYSGYPAASETPIGQELTRWVHERSLFHWILATA